MVLAAGLGTRLRPLTLLRPKALCPVGGDALVDLALAGVGAAVSAIAVNAHHGADQVAEHVGGRAHLSIERAAPLGTAGALGRLRGWLDGRAALVVNADAWHRADLAALVGDWDGERVRLLLAEPAGAGLRPTSRVVGCVLPWPIVAGLGERPAGLYGEVWRPAAENGRLEVLTYGGPFVDCGTPAGYLQANLAVSGGGSVVGEGAVVAGRLVRSVVWPGCTVGPAEVLVDAIRADRGLTVLVRRPAGA